MSHQALEKCLHLGFEQEVLQPHGLWILQMTIMLHCLLLLKKPVGLHSALVILFLQWLCSLSWKTLLSFGLEGHMPGMPKYIQQLLHMFLPPARRASQLRRYRRWLEEWARLGNLVIILFQHTLNLESLQRLKLCKGLFSCSSYWQQ